MTHGPDPLALVHAVLDGAADDAERAALEKWLREDPANVRTFAREAYLYQRTGELLERDDLADLVGRSSRAQPDDAGGAALPVPVPAVGGSAPPEPKRRRLVGLILAMVVLAVTAGVVGYYVAEHFRPKRNPSPAYTRLDVGYMRWHNFSQTLREDPDLLLYYTFAPDPDAPRTLRNLAQATRGRYDGRLGEPNDERTAPSWTDGRFPGKHALGFLGADKQHVVIPHADGLNLSAPCTVSLWVYNDTPVWTAHLLTKREDKPDGGYLSNLAIAWIGVDPVHHAGRRNYYHTFEFGDVGPNRAWTGPHESPEGLPNTPRWVNLTITYDGSQIVYYLDGERTAAKPVERNRAMAQVAGDLILGDSTTAGSQLKNSFDGRIDELVLLRRVWTDAEARAFYEVGRPVAE